MKMTKLEKMFVNRKAEQLFSQMRKKERELYAFESI